MFNTYASGYLCEIDSNKYFMNFWIDSFRNTYFVCCLVIKCALSM